MATGESEFHLRVRRKFQDKLLKDVNGEPIDYEGNPSNEGNPLMGPMGYRGKPESAYSLSNLLWLLAAGCVFYYTDFPLTLLYDPRTNKRWLNVGLVLITVNVSICLFLVIWLTYIRKMPPDDWEKNYPKAIPIASAAVCLGSIFLLVGLWPVWGILTPVILFTLLMGVVVAVAMLPSWL